MPPQTIRNEHLDCNAVVQENLVKQLASNPETQEQALELMATLQNNRDRAAERRQLFGKAKRNGGRQTRQLWVSPRTLFPPTQPTTVTQLGVSMLMRGCGVWCVVWVRRHRRQTAPGRAAASGGAGEA